MTFTTKFTPFICPCSSTIPSNFKNPPQKSHLFHLKPIKSQSLPPKTANSCTKNHSSISFQQFSPYPDDRVVSLRLKKLIAEFRALSEPIDRVRRLLDYAAVLPKLGESTRAPENRVPGCAAQVWLEVEVDELGRMRFGADSDSEITKGFCSCLIFLLDGAFPQDVFKVKAEDLRDMNVGLPVRSRVNSWHNVLIGMQERTRSLFAGEDLEVRQLDSLKTFPSLVIPADSVVAQGEVFVS